MLLECKKDRDSQTQDGVRKIQFSFNPDDIRSRLDLVEASPGTRFYMLIQEVDDNDLPVGCIAFDPSEIARFPKKKTPAAPPSPSGGVAGGRKWDDMPLSQRAGILCRDRDFHPYLPDVEGIIGPMSYKEGPIASAAADSVLKRFLSIQSKKELDTNEEAGKRFLELETRYRTEQGLMAERM